jgi:hypothetical protein
MHHGEVPEPRLRHLPDIEPDASMPRREGVRTPLFIGALLFPIIVSCKIIPQNIVCSRWLVLTTCVQLSFPLEEEAATAEEQSAVPFHPDDEACFLIDISFAGQHFVICYSINGSPAPSFSTCKSSISISMNIAKRIFPETRHCTYSHWCY